MLRYAITARPLIPLAGQDPLTVLVDQAHRLAVDGVDFLQVREKDLAARDLIGLTQRIITAARNAAIADRHATVADRPAGIPDRPGLRVLVNGRPDVAIASGADGVHLPSGPEQLTVGQVRQLLGQQRDLLVSVACHTLDEIERASKDGADLLLFSPVYGKLTAAGEQLGGTGLVRLAEACQAAGETPVLALGGITRHNAQACIDAGARGVAGIRLFH